MKRKHRRQKPKIKLLQAPRLARLKWLRHAFTTRLPGGFNLNYSAADRPAKVEKNRRALLRALGAKTPGPGWQLITLGQRHTDIIRAIARTPPEQLSGSERERAGGVKLVGDAAVTDQPGYLLAVQVADCLPILLVDVEQRVVAAVHAGWRGTLSSLAAKAVGRMRQDFGCKPKRILAAIGPGIHECCYEVGRAVVEAYEGRFPYGEKLFRRTQPSPSEVHWQQPRLEPSPGFGTRERRPRPAATSPRAERFHLDLVEANQRQLLAAGLQPGNIWASPFCTACRTDLFFSHRAEQGRTGRMMGVIGLVER